MDANASGDFASTSRARVPWDIGPRQHRYATFRSNLVGAMVNQGKFEDALTEMDAVVTATRAAWGDRHPQTLHEEVNVGFALQAVGRFEDAEAHLRRVLATAEEVLPAGHPIVLRGLTTLALVEQELDRHERAAELAGRVAQLQAAALGDDHLEVARARLDHGRAEAAAEVEAWLARLD